MCGLGTKVVKRTEYQIGTWHQWSKYLC